ncbi:cytochrome P450 family protein [Rhizoctonia solani AG-3 Rhs1AP]|uniref:Cytochrome P450 family protein n=1 Tax=Rhizoctonia solani AG-3 Rhs1AP TaxID=1086054 RepID=X8J493_9AGAM|nr:cytochrome P450 family protein [Rhizoctonia solani AG-3 Rhs1AP]
MSDLNHSLKTLGITLGAAVSLGLLVQRVLEYYKPPLPPSPRSYPFIGHLLSMPQSNQHLGFIELGKQLKSDIFSLRVLGQTMIVLNSVEVANKLLQNRSAIYSDRPRAPMLTEPSLLDASGLVSITGYNERWRKSRRLMHPWLNKQAVESFHHSQQAEARMLLQRLIHSSETSLSSEVLYYEVFTALSGTLLRSIYGYQISGRDDPFLREAIQLVHNLSDALMPTNFLVNIIPSLRYVPSWFPGAGWKRVTQAWREQKERTMMGLFSKAKESIDSGSDEPSMIASSLVGAEELGLSPEEVTDYLSYAGITVYLGGAETTSNIFLIFAIAMMLYPEEQRKAQMEIDDLIGDSRLPVMNDRHMLPYTNRLIQEILRWCPVTPTGVPHALTDNDTYEGFRMPTGAIVFANTWAMSRNEKVYKKPEEFNPDRFLDPSVPPCPVFGFGRRECPGNHFAESSIFIIIASLLAVFNVRIPKNARGEDIVPELTSKNTMI